MTGSGPCPDLRVETEVAQRLDALSLLAPMREGFIAHSRGRTAPRRPKARTRFVARSATREALELPPE